MATRKEPVTGLRKLLQDQVADIYYAEKKLIPALKKMAKQASNEDLSEAFADHHEETLGHVARLEEVFAALDMPVKGKKCDAIDGILQEATGMMEEFADDAALDAALVGAAQKVEHYEIASYGSMVAWAEQLGLEDVAGLLNETLEEERSADEKLTELAEGVVNAAGDEDNEEDDDQEEVATMRKTTAVKNATTAKPITKKK